ncbi:unnamed protein product, partial [Mesorhabditis belari]|uniref:Uncharacterized protein n=1 Tax=Mesorhabditis belari TaxID=2138241 RepID=A0AAF3EYD6_9BILA
MGLQWLIAKISPGHQDLVKEQPLSESSTQLNASSSTSKPGNDGENAEEGLFDAEKTLDELMAQVKIQLDDDKLENGGNEQDQGVSRRGSLARRQSNRKSLRTTSAIDVLHQNGDAGNEPHVVKAKKTQSSREPGLRSMLYGLTQKQKKEEQQARKLLRKQLGWLFLEMTKKCEK